METTFQQCRFRGTVPIMLGDDHSCSYITFTGCAVERSFGSWTPSASYSDIILEECSPGPYGHVEHITFRGCHVGVSNGAGGHDTGAPGAGLVAHCNRRTPIRQGYHDIRIIDCAFEATDEFTLDLDDKVKATVPLQQRRAHPGLHHQGRRCPGRAHVRLHDLHRGAGGSLVRGNTIYRGYINTFKICKNEDVDPGRKPLIVEGNTFDLTVDNGVPTPAGVSMIRLHGDNTIFRNNIIRTALSDDDEAGDAPGSILKLYNARSTQIAGNKVYDRSTVRPPLLAHVYAATGNTISSNYFWSTLPEGLQISNAAGSANNTWSNNTFAH